MKENKICVYAICKNEEQFVEKWVKSMSEADSIVVLDTGSTDGTVDKLRELGVTVKVKTYDPWRFDTPRNDAMDMAPEDCNILVSTDLDEILEPGWAAPLREKWIEGVHERAEYKYTWSHLADGSEGRSFAYNKIHTRKWRWRHPVHELLFNIETKTENYTADQQLNLFNEIHLHHYPDPTKSRGSYLSLLELRAQEDPEDYYGLIYLGHEYYYRGYYDKAIDLLNKILSEYTQHYNVIERASCHLFIGDSYFEKAKQGDQKSFDKCILSYYNAIAVDPTYREPYLNLGKVLIHLKDYDAAEYYIKKGLKKSFRHFNWLERDASWASEPYDLLCLACFYGGKKRDALAYAVKAQSMDKGNERLASNITLCLKNSNDIELIS